MNVKSEEGRNTKMFCLVVWIRNSIVKSAGDFMICFNRVSFSVQQKARIVLYEL